MGLSQGGGAKPSAPKTGLAPGAFRGTLVEEGEEDRYYEDGRDEDGGQDDYDEEADFRVSAAKEWILGLWVRPIGEPAVRRHRAEGRGAAGSWGGVVGRVQAGIMVQLDGCWLGTHTRFGVCRVGAGVRR
jgi:hypothetical protein